MKIILVSDSHGEIELLNLIHEKEYDSDYFLHAGDYCVPNYFVKNWGIVKGNCDYAYDVPLFIDIDTPLGKLHMEHGDNFRIKYNFEEYLDTLKCKFFVFGHTHNKLIKRIKDTIVLNPGSLTRPRDDNHGSYFVLEIDDKIKIITKLIVINDENKPEITTLKETIIE